MGTKIRKVMEPWHDENLVITKDGLFQMRTLVIVGAILGFAIGFFTCLLLIMF